jgi:hypothetical protein
LGFLPVVKVITDEYFIPNFEFVAAWIYIKILLWLLTVFAGKFMHFFSEFL